MVKFLIISFLILYLVFKLGGFFLRMFFRSLGARAQQKYTEQKGFYKTSKPQGSNVDIEYEKAKAKKTVIKGGEYVDYEEIK